MGETYTTYYYTCRVCGENKETTDPAEAKDGICRACQDEHDRELLGVDGPEDKNAWPDEFEQEYNEKKDK